MRIETIGIPEIIISNPDSKHNYFGWPTIVKLGDSRLIAGASGFRLEHICPFGKGVISYSDDKGENFTPPVAVIDTVLDDRDVGLCTFGNSGVIVTSFNNTRDMQRLYTKNYEKKVKDYIFSYLDTVSDCEENDAIGSNFRISRDGGVTFGEIHKSPVTSPHGPVELSDGTVLWVGANYFEKNHFEDYDKFIAAYNIDTASGEMAYVGKIPDIIENGKKLDVHEPYAVEADNGDIICHIRTEPNFTSWQSISRDKGKTWSVPEKLLPDYGGAPCHLLKHSSGVIMSLYGYRKPPYEIRAMFSVDEGKNWDKDHTLYVNGISDDLGYPATVELADGSLLTVFYAKTSSDSPCVIMKQHWKLITD